MVILIFQKEGGFLFPFLVFFPHSPQTPPKKSQFSVQKRYAIFSDLFPFLSGRFLRLVSNLRLSFRIFFTFTRFLFFLFPLAMFRVLLPRLGAGGPRPTRVRRSLKFEAFFPSGLLSFVRATPSLSFSNSNNSPLDQISVPEIKATCRSDVFFLRLIGPPIAVERRFLWATASRLLAPLCWSFHAFLLTFWVFASFPDAGVSLLAKETLYRGSFTVDVSVQHGCHFFFFSPSPVDEFQSSALSVFGATKSAFLDPQKLF